MGREKLAENLLGSIPIIFKKLIKAIPIIGISRHQLELLFKINNEDRKPMSYYSEKMMVPKSNLTVMSNKLIEEGLIERLLDPNDRRIIILKITEKGEQYVREHKKRMMQGVAKRLESLNDDDVKRLNDLIGEMRCIFEKLDQ